MNAIVRKTIIRIIAATAILYAPMVSAADITTFASGSLHENFVSVGKKQIPLPTGKWELMFSHTAASTGEGSLANAARVSAWLLRRDGGRPAAAMVLRTNSDQIDGSGWRRPPTICDRKNVHFNQSDKLYDRRKADCWQVNQLVNTYTRSRNPTYQNMKNWARRNLGTTTALGLQFWINDGYDALRVDYLVNPVHFGFPALDEREWNASQWHPAFVKAHRESERAIEALRNTGENLHRLIQKGFRNELHGYVSDFALSLTP